MNNDIIIWGGGGVKRKIMGDILKREGRCSKITPKMITLHVYSPLLRLFIFGIETEVCSIYRLIVLLSGHSKEFRNITTYGEYRFQ